MERVQFQQEQMLAELKDLVQKGLFAQKEVKQIMKKRTQFETALVRRVAKKADFLRYAAYEMQLEALRKKRQDRLDLPPAPPSISDYALVRRQFHIFERALKKFKDDVGLWIQYIQIAKKEGARALVGRITARALQLHPSVPQLYIIAATHEIDHLSPSAARSLLQRGLRLNKDSVELWTEYVKMELGFVESMRRRWELLGISVGGTGKEKQAAEDEEMLALETVDKDVDAQTESDAAREAIMEGAIVKSVISNAAQALPTMALFTALQRLISEYPAPGALRRSLLEHLHAHLKSSLPSDADAIRLHATRHLHGELDGDALVEALKDANEELSAAVLSADEKTREAVGRVYAEFVAEWFAKDLDDNLRLYLVNALGKQAVLAPIMAAHVRMLISSAHPEPKAKASRVVKLARRYTERCPAAEEVWLARLEAEWTVGEREEAVKLWRACGSREGRIWSWGLGRSMGTCDGPAGAGEEWLSG